MKLFHSKGQGLKPVKVAPFKLESEIQSLVEGNTEVLFGLQMVVSELRVQDKRFDSLCFDEETKSFVIIEYKKGASYSVIDQGYTYLSLMLNNKADILLEYNETTGRQLRRGDIDWSQSRIIFISPKFTEYQRMSVNFKNLPFELFEIQNYDNGMVGLTAIATDSEVDIKSVVPIAGKDNVVQKVSQEVIRYDEDYHLNPKKGGPSSAIKELYGTLKERIMLLSDEIDVKVKKMTIGFNLGKVTVCDVKLQSASMPVVINMRKGQLNDRLNLAEDVSEKGHHGNGDYRFGVKSEDDVEYALYLIKQSLKDKED